MDWKFEFGSDLNSDCVDLLDQRLPCFSLFHFMDWKFEFGSDLKPKVGGGYGGFAAENWRRRLVVVMV
uniref:Uncharacterized protein n=1 Tax=Fagus sylvatica TaxID=28930 RepID=A0A2N9HY63_FAGSY